MAAVEYGLERVRELLKLARDNGPSELGKSILHANLQSLIEPCEKQVKAVNETAADWKEPRLRTSLLHWRMAELSEAVTELFEPVWRLGSARKPPPGVAGKTAEHKLVDQVELFIASRVLDFLRRVYPQMVNMVEFAVAGILAMMLSSSGYPMPAANTALSLAWGAILTVVGVSMYVFIRMNMSRVISMLQGTRPGYFNLTSSFAMQLFFFGVLPGSNHARGAVPSHSGKPFLLGWRHLQFCPLEFGNGWS